MSTGPFYDPKSDSMVGGVVNSYNAIAFAKTSFAMKVSEAKFSITEMNARSAINRLMVEDAVDEMAKKDICPLSLGVNDAVRRGAAVTLLRVEDDEEIAAIAKASNRSPEEVKTEIVTRSKSYLTYVGLKVGDKHIPGMDAARYLNTYPGTPGDYRAWIGGIRDKEDIEALVQCIAYAYNMTKLAVLEEMGFPPKEQFCFIKDNYNPDDKLNKFYVDDKLLANMREDAETMAAVLGGIEATKDVKERRRLFRQYGDNFVKANKRFYKQIEENIVQ